MWNFGSHGGPSDKNSILYRIIMLNSSNTFYIPKIRSPVPYSVIFQKCFKNVSEFFHTRTSPRGVTKLKTEWRYVHVALQIKIRKYLQNIYSRELRGDDDRR
jgi:hypothetical protein